MSKSANQKIKTSYRQEATEDLGLNVESPSEKLYSIMKDIYDDIAEELELTVPYKPMVILGGQNDVAYDFERAIIESVEGGSHKFISEGRLKKHRVLDPETGIAKEGIEDMRKLEGVEI